MDKTMSDQETLEKAVKKAIDGGWKPGWQDRRPVVSWSVDYSTDFDEGEGVLVWGHHAKSSASSWFFPINELIFNHNFAKALWGEAQMDGLELMISSPSILTGAKHTHYWQYYLQMMVIDEDPINYLGEHI
jgi:hypothetical protein